MNFDYPAVFEALSDLNRLHILLLIMNQEDELPCAVLDEVLPLSKSTISYHVKALRRAELVYVRKEGRNYHYGLRYDVFARYLPGLLSTLEEVQRGWGFKPRSLDRKTSAGNVV